jgi:hypothetical protein
LTVVGIELVTFGLPANALPTAWATRSSRFEWVISKERYSLHEKLDLPL